MSCNGCRVLRKGCSESCILRSSIQWIENPEAQGYATLFVAKFFGRADLMSFISVVPLHQRPALFQSLLFEACGRTVNPVNGAVGLLWSGNWSVCQAAVQIVLSGGVLRPMPPQLLARVLSTPRPLHNPHRQSNPREQPTGSSDSPDVFQVDDSSASAHRNSWTRPIPSMYYNNGRDHHNSVQRNESVLHSQPPLLPSDLRPSSLAMMAVDEEVGRRQNIRRESTPFESSEVSGTTASFENEEPAMGSGGKKRKLLNLFV